MPPYVRPDVAVGTFTDADGEVIPYGSRWQRAPYEGSPPDWAYSMTSNLARFGPLHAVADALIAWLAAEYDVEITDGLAAADDLLHPRTDLVRAVRLTPTDAAAAPLTFAYTSLPSVIVHAGALHDFLFPVCVCDACDEDTLAIADQLEWTVRAVASGGFQEDYRPNDDLAVSFRLEEDGVGRDRGSSRLDGIAPSRACAAFTMLAARETWKAWPQRR